MYLLPDFERYKVDPQLHLLLGQCKNKRLFPIQLCLALQGFAVLRFIVVVQSAVDGVAREGVGEVGSP